MFSVVFNCLTSVSKQYVSTRRARLYQTTLIRCINEFLLIANKRRFRVNKTALDIQCLLFIGNNDNTAAVHQQTADDADVHNSWQDNTANGFFQKTVAVTVVVVVKQSVHHTAAHHQQLMVVILQTKSRTQYKTMNRLTHV